MKDTKSSGVEPEVTGKVEAGEPQEKQEKIKETTAPKEEAVQQEESSDEKIDDAVTDEKSKVETPSDDETAKETESDSNSKPADTDELEPATAYEKKPDIVDNLADNLEKQLNEIVGMPAEDVSMDSKIDNAIAKIVNETVGDIPVAPTVASTASPKQATQGQDNRFKEQQKITEKSERQLEKEERKAEKSEAKAAKKAAMEQDPDAYASKKKKKRIIIGSILGVLLVAALGTYGGFAYHYKDILYHGTTINGFDCSELTVAQAEDLIRKQVEDYSIKIDFRDGTSESITGTDIDYKYVSDGGVQRIKEEQSPLLWIKGYIEPESYEVAKGIEYDHTKLQEKYLALTGVSDAAQVAPTDAYVTYEGSGFVIVPETEGNQIDRDALLTKLNEAVSGSQTELNVADADVYNHPAVYQDAPQLATERDQLNNLASVNVTYVLPQGNQVLDGNVVKEWLTVDSEGNYSISDDDLEEHIEEYVDQLADDTNTVGTSRPFHATLQGDITVSGGSYGWRVNKSEEIEQLTDDIKNHTVVEREPAYSSREVTTANHGFGDTYIEVDLGNQHLWYYIDGELYMDSAFVSGRYSVPDRRTPAGLFLLTYKQRDRVLRGPQREDGSYEYESPVKYWMPFNGGIGFHDASWRGSFGGTIYRYGGSHGCINMPTSKAATMYEKIDKQTPIILFY